MEALRTEARGAENPRFEAGLARESRRRGDARVSHGHHQEAA